MSVIKYILRLMAVKHKRVGYYSSCRLCNNWILPGQKHFIINRWTDNRRIKEVCYCKRCVKSRFKVIKEVDTDSDLYGIAYVDDYYNFKKKDYTRYLRRKEREEARKNTSQNNEM